VNEHHPAVNQRMARMARNLFWAEGCIAQSGGYTEAEADADKLDIPIHAFDLIIADECHRG
jgi:type I restriction enzyme R subunit